MEEPLAFVIEDNLDLALVYCEAVKGAGYRVESIVTGTQGMVRLKESTPDLVVLDLHLPGVSGVEICQYIRSIPRLNAVPVMIVSADERLADIVDDATLVLLKPVSLMQLRDLARRLNSSHQPPEQDTTSTESK